MYWGWSGDPELLTLKAINLLRSVNCLAVPKWSQTKGLAQQIVESLLPAGTTTPKLLPLLFPMTRDADVRETHHRKAAEDIIDMLDAGQSVAMVTIGDPTIYSTCFYVKHKVEDKGFAVEVVPGITSITAAASKAGIALSEQKESIQIIPGVSTFDDIKVALVDPRVQTLVVMKAGKIIHDLRDLMSTTELVNEAVVVSRLGFSDEVIKYVETTTD